MASIRKRGDKYHVQFRRQGFEPLTRSFSKLSDAREWARQTEAQADRHELAPSRKELKQLTLADLIIRYRDKVTPRKKGAQTETVMLNAFLRHPICRKSLASLLPSDFAAYRDELLSSVKPASVRRQLMTVQSVLTKAMQDWDIPLSRNPLSGVKLTSGENKRQRRLSVDEMDRLRTAVRSDTNPYTILVVGFAIETAMRRGEILSLQWGDIDLERSCAVVREAKNGTGRLVPLTRTATQILRQAAMLTDDQKGPVFPLAVVTLHASWKALLRRANISDFRFHDLRHEAISRLFEIGLTAPEVASISGHRTVSQLFRYAHANQASVRAKLLGNDAETPSRSYHLVDFSTISQNN